METQLDMGRGLSVKNKLRSVVIRNLFSARMRDLRRQKAEMQRRVGGKPHRVDAFLQIDDPYSYLLSTYLSDLEQSYDIELHLHPVQALGDEYQPEPGLLAEYAVIDCERVAHELGIPFLDRGTAPPTEYRIGLTDAVAAGALDLREALAIYWRGDTTAAARRADDGAQRGSGEAAVSKASAKLKRLGHYNSGVLHYGGEWYWGVDRLHYLLRRLDELGVCRAEQPLPKLAAIEQAMKVTLPFRPPAAAAKLPPLEFFVSLRSPYTAIALPRVFDIADAFGLDLKFRLVMPMVMRGMQVPKRKMLYIAADTFREAEYRHVTFGNFADPVGAGIERLYAVHHYARDEKRERDYLLNAGRAVWAEGVDVATDAGLRQVTGKTGLFWPEAKAALQSDDWRDEVEANREALMEAGSWGVPTLKLDDFVIWGQDRLWLLVRHLEDRCDTGDGILI